MICYDNNKIDKQRKHVNNRERHKYPHSSTNSEGCSRRKSENYYLSGILKKKIQIRQ